MFTYKLQEHFQPMHTYVCHAHMLVTDDKYKGSVIVLKFGVVKNAENMKFSTRKKALFFFLML